MILSGQTIRKLVKEGQLVIDPFREDSLQAASYDFHLAPDFLIVDANAMDVITFDKEITYREIKGSEITIPPYGFILASTEEFLKVPANMTVRVEGRSSIGRMGLFIQNAGWIDPGYEGRITLELYNANPLPIKLTAGRRICQFVFTFTDEPVEKPYAGKYKGDRGTVGSRVFKDRESRTPH